MNGNADKTRHTPIYDVQDGREMLTGVNNESKRTLENMEKLVMDALEFGSFIHEVIHKLPFLKKYAASKSSYDTAIHYANNINLTSEKLSTINRN